MKLIPSKPNYFATLEGSITRNGKTIKPRSNGRGYLRIKTSVCGQLKDAYVHRLVCEAYHGPCPPNMECRHKDGNRSNNAPGNLQWATKAQNEADKKNHGTIVRGERVKGAKLTQEQVIAIRREVTSGRSIKEIAPAYGVTPQSLSSVVSGSRWKHVPGAVRAKLNTRRLTPEQISEIRSSRSTLKDLAKKFGVTSNSIWQVRARQTYVDLP